MVLELQSPLTLAPNTFNDLIGPEEMLIDSLNCSLKNLQRLQVLYVCGNYFRILDKLDRRFTELDVGRGGFHRLPAYDNPKRGAPDSDHI